MRYWCCFLGLQVTALALAPTPPPTPACPVYCHEYEATAQCNLPECAPCAPWPAPCAVTTPPPFLTKAGPANASSSAKDDGAVKTTPLPALKRDPLRKLEIGAP